MRRPFYAWLYWLSIMLGSWGCDGNFLKVDVVNVGPIIDNLRVLILLNGQLANQRLSFALPSMPDAQTVEPPFSFVLQFPPTAQGTLELSMVGSDTGCLAVARDFTMALVSSGSAQEFTADMGIDLFSVGPSFYKDCPLPDKLPTLFYVDQTSGLPAQAGRTLIIDGWGLLPDCTFTMNSVPAEVVKWHSLLQVEVNVPATINLMAPVLVTVRNPDGASDSGMVQL